MMGKTRSFQEAKATLNGSLLVGNISFGTTYSGWLFSLSNLNLCTDNLNLCNDIEEGQMEDYKKKERQREGWPFSLSNLNLCNDIEEGQMEEYKKKERQRESGCLGWSNANICNEIEKGQMEEYKKKERQKEAKETPIANRELMEEITNDERNDMEEEQMEEIEIKEGHDDVEEEQNNKITMPIFNFCRNLLNEERGQVEGNKIEEGQEEVQEEQDNERAKQDRYLRRRFPWDCQRDHLMLSTMPKLIDIEIEPTEVDLKYLRSRVELADPSVYFRSIRRDCLDCRRDHLRLCTMPKLIDIEIEPTEFLEEQLGHQPILRMKQLGQQPIFRKKQLGQQLFFREEQLGRQLFWDPFEEKMGIRSILFQGGQSRRKLFERTIKTTLIEMMGKWKQREGNAVVEDDAIMEREKQTDVTEKLSGEFDDEEKEKRELEQLLRCKVCLDSDACVVLFPCRHMATCEYCEGFLQCCPVCRSFIDEAVKVNEEN